MAVEIANLVQAMCQFEADATPQLGNSSGISAVTRNSAGNYKLVLDQKVTPDEVLCHVSVGPIASPGIAVPYWGVDGDGDIQIEVRNATVAADPSADVYVAVLRFPTKE